MRRAVFRIRIHLNPDPAKNLNPDPEPEDLESGFVTPGESAVRRREGGGGGGGGGGGDDINCVLPDLPAFELFFAGPDM